MQKTHTKKQWKKNNVQTLARSFNPMSLLKVWKSTPQTLSYWCCSPPNTFYGWPDDKSASDWPFIQWRVHLLAGNVACVPSKKPTPAQRGRNFLSGAILGGKMSPGESRYNLALRWPSLGRQGGEEAHVRWGGDGRVGSGAVTQF